MDSTERRKLIRQIQLSFNNPIAIKGALDEADKKMLREGFERSTRKPFLTELLREAFSGISAQNISRADNEVREFVGKSASQATAAGLQAAESAAQRMLDAIAQQGK